MPVSIDPGRLEDFFLIQIPTRGSAEINCDGVHFTSSAHCASIISPDTPVSMRWPPMHHNWPCAWIVRRSKGIVRNIWGMA
ncbi:hypothetical protein BV361_03797 [Pseudomonas syringae pv. actinidiae]|nr:hypothetical protein BV361_03797 [Pseudomonas syringae pv. actinidiae]